jgi:ABC-type protease/lipase transport system fused ATPase/permease subunit
MAEKDVQWGMITIMIAVIFLMSGLEMLDFVIFSEHFSTLIAFILVAVGVYLITKK